MEDSRVFTSSQIIEEVTEIEMDGIKGNTRSKRISVIRKLYIDDNVGFWAASNRTFRLTFAVTDC